tara:strand:- start:383 stop:1288 length:906 start_codon:yes stop_codon:yes gene_type:complete
MAFTDKIKQYAGDIANLDTASAMAQAVDHTLGVVKASNMPLLTKFARKMDVKTTIASGYNLRDKNVFDVVKVEREVDSSGTPRNYVCQPVSSKQIHDVSDSSSIYYAQSYSPVYTVDFESNLKIFPDTSAANNGYMYLVYGSDSKTISDGGSTITDNAETVFGSAFSAAERFPELWKQYFILHSAEILVQEKMSNFSERITEVQDALDKAQTLIDDNSEIGGDGAVITAQEWLEDEDEDMTASTVQVASQELQRATTELNKLNGQYQYEAGQLQSIQMRKKEFLQSQGIGGVSDNPTDKPV